MTGLLDKLRLLVLTSVFAAVATVAPRAQELLFWPYTLDGASGYFGQAYPHVSLSGAIGSDGSVVNGLDFQTAATLFDSQWADFTSDLNAVTGQSQVLTNTRTLSADAPNHFLLGDGRLGIQTEKSVRGSDPLRRNECTTDDECADYSSLPKTEPGKRNLKTLRKPFIGLSITKPLQ
jgi:hypothetical protein